MICSVGSSLPLPPSTCHAPFGHAASCQFPTSGALSSNFLSLPHPTGHLLLLSVHSSHRRRPCAMIPLSCCTLPLPHSWYLELHLAGSGLPMAVCPPRTSTPHFLGYQGVIPISRQNRILALLSYRPSALALCHHSHGPIAASPYCYP